MSSTKKVRELQDTIRELQRIIGSKQVRIDYLEKLIEITERDEGIDIKKKGSRPRSGSGRTGRG